MNDIEARLADLSDSIDWPEADLQQRVLDGIRTRAGNWGRRLSVAAVAALVILGLISLPGARHALADFLEVVGIQIEWLTGGVEIDETELGLTGEPIDLTSAAASIDAELRRPSALDIPDRVHLDRGGVVMLWAPDRDLPESLPGSGVGLVLEQFPAVLDQGLLSKGIPEGTDVEVVSIGQSRGYAITGAPHAVYYMVGSAVRQAPSRLAANVLVWESGGVVRRLEGAVERDRLIELAESLIPITPG